MSPTRVKPGSLVPSLPQIAGHKIKCLGYFLQDGAYVRGKRFSFFADYRVMGILWDFLEHTQLNKI